MTKILPSLLSATLAMASAAVLPAQNRSVVPAACRTLPGNAALSMPLRWSHGTMQVRIDAALLPTGFVGQTITGIRLRRPTFLGEPAYAPLQRTLTVRGGFQGETARQLTQALAANRPQNLAVLFGPATVSVAASPAPGAGTSVGEDFLQIPFTTPLPVVAGNLLLEFESSDAPLQVGSGHWVDAVWFENGNETGYAVTLGDGSCTTRPAPTELVWNDPLGPRVGTTAALRLTGAPAGGFAIAWFGLEPEPRAAGASFVGFGGSLGLLDPSLGGCHQWAPIDASWGGSADAGGSYDVSFALTAGVATVGLRIGVQAAWLDPGRPGLPLSVSNGVMLVLDQIGVADRCATVFFPGASVNSPWVPYFGQMPVLGFDH